MSKSNHVSKINIYHPPGERPVTDANLAGGVPVEFVEGQYPGPVLKHLGIEDPDVRKGLTPEEANICIAVEPGEDAIGQIHICVQYEGKKGMTNECMQGQNDLSASLGEWLNELFEDCEADWDFQIHAEPCPKSEEPYRTRELVSQLRGQTIEQSRQIEQMVQQTQREHTVKRTPN